MSGALEHTASQLDRLDEELRAASAHLLKAQRVLDDLAVLHASRSAPSPEASR